MRVMKKKRCHLTRYEITELCWNNTCNKCRINYNVDMCLCGNKDEINDIRWLNEEIEIPRESHIGDIGIGKNKKNENLLVRGELCADSIIIEEKKVIPKYYYVTVNGKAGFSSDVPKDACIVTDGIRMISNPINCWTLPAYIYVIQPDARIKRTVEDCVKTIKDMIAKQ